MNITCNQKLKHIILDLKQMKGFCEDPIIISRGKGIKIWDINGKEYIDAISGIFVAGLGHGNERVIEAVRKQQDKISFVAPLHAISDISMEYAYRLSKITPGDLNTIKLLCGGSEATETAMRMARQYHHQTGNQSKYKVIGVYGEYHGGTMGALSATGMAGPRRSKAEPLMSGFYHVMPPLCFKCAYGQKHPECGCLCAKMLVKTIELQDPSTVSAVILEPISNTGGIVVPPVEYFGIIREACTKYNVLLIYDEIITGFGRTGEWFAAQTFGITPDFICAGKGMSAGYAPAACVAVSDRIYYKGFWAEDLEERQFSGGHTYGTNPISASACMAVLDEIEENDLIRKGNETGKYLKKRIQELITPLGILGEVRGKGFLMAVQFVRDSEKGILFDPSKRFGKRIEKRLLEKGLILRCDLDWIAFAPPLNTTTSEIDEIMCIFIECIKDELKEMGNE